MESAQYVSGIQAMKCLALVTVIVFALAQQPTKTPENKGTAKGSSSNVAEQTNTGEENPRPTAKTALVPDKTGIPIENKVESASQDSHAPSPYEELEVQRGLTRFTGLLAVVGVLQLFVLLGQTILFRRQTKIMGQHKTSLEQLATAAIDNAVAASKNADAGRQAVDIVISKERARLSISADNLSLANPGLQWVNYKIQISGLTNASVLSSQANVWITDSLESSLPSQSHPMHALPVRIKPFTEIERKAFVWPDLTLSQPEISEIISGNKFVHFVGFIKYRDDFYDVFKNERVTEFAWVWRFLGIAGDATPTLESPGRMAGYWKEHYYRET